MDAIPQSQQESVTTPSWPESHTCAMSFWGNAPSQQPSASSLIRSSPGNISHFLPPRGFQGH